MLNAHHAIEGGVQNEQLPPQRRHSRLDIVPFGVLQEAATDRKRSSGNLHLRLAVSFDPLEILGYELFQDMLDIGGCGDGRDRRNLLKLAGCLECRCTAKAVADEKCGRHSATERTRLKSSH